MCDFEFVRSCVQRRVYNDMSDISKSEPVSNNFYSHGKRVQEEGKEKKKITFFRKINKITRDNDGKDAVSRGLTKYRFRTSAGGACAVEGRTVNSIAAYRVVLANRHRMCTRLSIETAFFSFGKQTYRYFTTTAFSFPLCRRILEISDGQSQTRR